MAEEERRQIDPKVGFDVISVTEDSTGQIYRASTIYGHNFDNPITMRSSATYVTGTHNYKAGFMIRVRGNGPTYNNTDVNGSMNFNFLNGVPRRVTLFATPIEQRNDIKADLSVFAQDSWATGPMTINYGIRFDYLNAAVHLRFDGDSRALLNRLLDNTITRSPQILSVIRDAVAALPQLIDQLETGHAPQANTADIVSRAHALKSSRRAPTPTSGRGRRWSTACGCSRRAPCAGDARGHASVAGTSAWHGCRRRSSSRACAAHAAPARGSRPSGMPSGTSCNSRSPRSSREQAPRRAGRAGGIA